MLAGAGTQAVMLAAIIFGFTTFPIYSVAAAHAHDFATSDQRVELSAALMFYYAVGAIAAPLLASYLIAGFGPMGMFAMIGAGHVGLIVFGILRMRVRATPDDDDKTRFIVAPRTSFLIGRLTRRSRDPKG
jgi:MFS family permease